MGGVDKLAKAEAEARSHSLTGSFAWEIASGDSLCSDETFQIMGFDRGIEPSIDQIIQRIHPDDRALAQHEFNRAKQGVQHHDLELRLLMPDLKVKHLRLIADRAKYRSGKEAIIGALMDITARKEVENELRHDEQRYRELFNYVPVALLEIDARKSNELLDSIRSQGVSDVGAYLEENPEFERLVVNANTINNVNQRTVELFGARNATDLYGSPTAPMFTRNPRASRRGMESRFRGEKSFQDEMKIKTLDGRLVDVLCTVARPDEGGRNFIALIDITERKKIEEALGESELRYRHLFDHMPVAMLQANVSGLTELFDSLRADGVTDLGAYANQHPEFVPRAMDVVVVERVNEQAIKTLGAQNKNQLLGTAATFWHGSPDTFLRALEARFRGLNMFQEEMKFLTLDGREIDVLFTSDTLESLDKATINLNGFVDITDRVRAQDKLQKLQAEFAHAARISLLGELAASIAHEVNQPLGAIRTNSETSLRWLDRPEPNVAKARELMRRTVDDAGRAADIIARIRIMATGRLPEQTELSLQEVIEESVIFMRNELQSKRVSVSLDLTPALPKLTGDRTQLQQVVVNLAINAVQAMAQSAASHRTLLIRTELSDAETLSCVFEDSGPGIDPLHLGRLFDSFFTTKDTGMGMGLSVSRSIIEAHGGQLRADNNSTLGGARFSFALPLNGAAAG